MRLRGDPSRYGALAATLHWLTAAAIFAMLPLGFLAAHTPDPVRTAALLKVHLPLGVLVLLLIVVRLAWMVFDVRPARPANAPRWQTHAATLNHVGLYGVVLLLCGSGIALIRMSGLAPVIFEQGRVASAVFARYPVLRLHVTGAALILALLTLHLCATLYHQFIRRDHPLARMRLTKPAEER